MKRCALSAFMLIFSFFIFTGSLFAQFDFPKGKWWKHPEVLEKINITEEQIQKIEQISNDSIKKIIELEGKFKIARLDLENLLEQIDQKKLDLGIFEKQIDVVNKLKGELEKERLMMLARIRNVLPKEAIQELKNLRGKVRKRFKENRRGLLEDDIERGPLGNDAGNDDLERPGHFY